MTPQPRIVLDPTVLAGQPVVRGTRLSLFTPLPAACDG